MTSWTSCVMSTRPARHGLSQRLRSSRMACCCAKHPILIVIRVVEGVNFSSALCIFHHDRTTELAHPVTGLGNHPHCTTLRHTIRATCHNKQISVRRAPRYHLTHRNCLTFAQHLAASKQLSFRRPFNALRSSTVLWRMFRGLKPPRPFPDWILGILEVP